jgi:AmiR/NasT family two-component response regulator
VSETQEVQPEPKKAEAKEEAAKPSKRAVVAEDEVLIRMDIVETLQEGGYDVVGEAGNGEEGVNLAREHHPDVVVMDIKMPVMDGLTAAEHIANEHLAPVVILTAFSQTDLVERAREAGAMAYVVKPFTPADLIPAVEIARSRYLEIKALEEEISDITERMEIRKKVERAKGLLMEKMKLNEPEAFRWIQKTSMDRRLTMREVAEAVIEQMAAKKEPKKEPKKESKEKGKKDAD